MFISRVILVRTVKGACLVGSCLATMEEAVPLPPEEHAAHACQALVAPSVSIAVMTGALPSHVGTEASALKKSVSHFSIVSVQVDSWENDASKVLKQSFQVSPALRQTVKAKHRMVFVTRNVTHFLVVGMVATVPWQRIPGLSAQIPAVGVHSTIANVMNSVTMLTVCMTTLTAEAKKKFASEFDLIDRVNSFHLN